MINLKRLLANIYIKAIIKNGSQDWYYIYRNRINMINFYSY